MRKYNFSYFVLFILLMNVVGCDQKDNKIQSAFPVKNVVKKYDREVTLTGTVGNNDGPISSAKIEVADDKGNTIATTQLQGSARYSVTIPAGTVLPIVISAYPEPEDGKIQKLIVAVIDPGLKRNDINELTTIIAEKAKAMGGYSYENMSQAAMTSTAIPDANKTTGGFRGDPTSQYGGWH